MSTSSAPTRKMDDEFYREQSFTETLQALSAGYIGTDVAGRCLVDLYPEWGDPTAHPEFRGEFSRLLQADAANVISDETVDRRLRHIRPQWFEGEA